MNSIHWRTSRYSGGNGGECVQVAAKPGPGMCSSGIARIRTARVLTVKLTEWRRFTDHIKH
jgi:Domain of unknown function (DUF397)